ncbi:MAG: bacteriohopanetetrol glucosamine biosynthesis glycosyltransferase HpnI [Steroidobacteraceae bacterium]
MTAIAHPGLVWCGVALAAFAMIYGVIAYIAVSIRIRSSGFTPRDPPAVTILKPLCGADRETYRCLRSFCDQVYPQFQIVFGVRDSTDPALDLVERLRAEFPRVDFAVAVDRRQHGTSRKVSNLINMLPLARHEYLVVSDSDVIVKRDYLAKVAGPLLDGGVGIVTCAYRGCPRRGLWSLLGSMFINEWFMPSVRVAAMAGSRAFAFGTTIGIRRQVLDRIGGFATIANQLADDYRLGELTRGLGLRTVLSEVVVETAVAESSFGDLVRHELRWLRTIRALRPMGYGFCFITFGMPVAGLGVLMARGAAPAVGMLCVLVLTRIMLHMSVRRAGSSPLQIALLPVRDTLSCLLWVGAFFTRSVHWRKERYRVGRDGSVHLVENLTP